ncbi:MAG: hypothetical protein NBV68_18960, partial [Erythrobacter sp.]|nr:hypothetical protein [Erythrobacter sp.]
MALLALGEGACSPASSIAVSDQDVVMAREPSSATCPEDDDGSCDRAMVDAALKGMTVEQFIERERTREPYYARCPDTGYWIDESCKFEDATGILKSQGTANDRVGRTINRCTEHV